MLRNAAATLATLLAAAAALALLLLDTAPRVPGPGAADARAAAQAQDLAERLKALAAAREGAAVLRIDEGELNGALAATARMRPGFAGRARIEPGGIALDLAQALPGTPLWLNLSATLAPGEGLDLRRVRLGRLPLPGPLAAEALRLALDRTLGPGTGRLVADAVHEVSVTGSAAEIALAASPADRAALEARARSALGPGAVAADPARLARHLEAIRRYQAPAGSGRSVALLLRHAAEAASRAGAGKDADTAREEMRAALFALAIACGDARFATLIGAAAPDWTDTRENPCNRFLLGGQVDLRKHFVVSAGLHAATSRPAAEIVGAFKELADSDAGGTGFSFDDMAANLAGARFAEALLAAGPAGRRAMLARLEEEADLMPETRDLPSGLSEAAFRAAYGSVDSPEYRRKIDLIRARIEALPLYRNAS